MILELLFELWNSVPDPYRFAVADCIPFFVYILRAAAAAGGRTYFEDVTIGG